MKIPRHSPTEVLHTSGIEVNTFDELYAQSVAQQTIYEEHRASFHHIFRYSGAGNSHLVAGKRIVAEEDCLLVVNPDIRQRYSRRQCRGDMILFQNSFLGRNKEKTDFMNSCTLFKCDYVVVPLRSESFAARVDSYFSLMKQTFDNKEEQGSILLCNWLHNLLIVIEREYRRLGSELVCSEMGDCMQRFQASLDEHYRTQKQVQFYAAQLGVTETKLSRIVYAERGISAKEYIGERLMLKAVYLMKNTTLNQNEIAARLGFDFSHFIKFFRRQTGITPAKSRKLLG